MEPVVTDGLDVEFEERNPPNTDLKVKVSAISKEIH